MESGMKLAIGSYRVRSVEFPSYDDMERFVTADGNSGEILGLDAAAFVSFWALEAVEPFGMRSRRLGLVMARSNGGPDVLVLHPTAFLIGLNSKVVLVDLTKPLTQEINLDTWFSAFIEEEDLVVAIHELGALALRIPECEVVGSLSTGIVAEATLSNRTLVLISDDDSKSELDLGESAKSPQRPT